MNWRVQELSHLGIPQPGGAGIEGRLAFEHRKRHFRGVVLMGHSRVDDFSSYSKDISISISKYIYIYVCVYHDIEILKYIYMYTYHHII